MNKPIKVLDIGGTYNYWKNMNYNCNSVIEHLFTAGNQNKKANEVRRLGKKYMIQTPKWFPIEPHWLFPFSQFFPKKNQGLFNL